MSTLPVSSLPILPQNLRTDITAHRLLENRIRHWISKQTREEVADRFYPWVQNTLQDLGYELEEQVSDDRFNGVIATLRKADIDPSRMEHALQEARRAQDENLSTLEWIREVQSRAFSSKMAQKSLNRAKRRLGALGEESFQSSPSAEQIFVFFLIWEEMGGTPTFATIREIHRREEGTPPVN